MTNTDIRSYLRSHGLRLDTDQGQHFLVSDEVLDAIVATAEILPEDRVIEIGPGIGILTKELVTRAKSVTSVEIDARFPALIRDFTGHPKNLTIIEGNALHAALPTNEPYKIIANIPYHITSPLLHRFLLEEKRRPETMTLLIQREVAENICAKGTESILTLLVQLFGRPSLVALVPPEAFLPPPKVDSAILFVDLYPEPKGNPEQIEQSLMLLKHANKERRKMLRNTIFNLPSGEEAMKKANIDPTRRPQTLTVDDWLRLADAFLGR